LDSELHFLSRVQSESLKHVAKRSSLTPPVTALHVDRKGPELPRENGLGGGFQVVIQTPEVEGDNLLNKHGLLRHVEIMGEIADYKVFLHGESVPFPSPLQVPCQFQTLESRGHLFQTPRAGVDRGSLIRPAQRPARSHHPLHLDHADRLFLGGFETARALPASQFRVHPFPHAMHDCMTGICRPDVGSFISSLPKGNITWKNLDPTKVLNEVGVLFDLGTIGNFFERVHAIRGFVEIFRRASAPRTSTDGASSHWIRNVPCPRPMAMIFARR
jgi:patched 1 protein